MTTQHQPGVIPAPNHLNQDFSAESANRKWGNDFTYIDTAEGWLFLAIILDLFSRKVVGWAMSQQMNTALVEAALDMAGFTSTSTYTGFFAPFRSRQSIHQCGIPKQLEQRAHLDEYESGWKLLRQCSCRKFLCHA